MFSLENDQGESFGTSTKTTEIATLREMFPDKTEDELKTALDASSPLEEAVNMLVVSQTDQSVSDTYESLIAHDTENSVNDDCIYDDEHHCDEDSTATETFSSSTDLQNLLLGQKKEKLKDGEYFRLKIRREQIWEDTYFKWKRAEQKEFTKHIKVQFIEEPAVDHGGPSREFFSLFNVAALAKLIYSGA